MSKLLLPKFLTSEVAEKAIYAAINAFEELTPINLERPQLHVTVLVPAMIDNDSDWPNLQVEPVEIASVDSGDKEKWPYDFANIARCKALQIWQDRSDGTNITPHLLFPGDTPFSGGVKREGIVVACSGLDECMDKMIAGMTADICIALAHDAWMKSGDKADNKLCFLTD